MFAEAINRNEFDPVFLGQLLQVFLLLGALGVGAKALRRKPPIDIDIENLKGEMKATNERLHELKRSLAPVFRTNEALANVNHQLADIRERLQSGDDIIGMLRERQSTNAAKLDSIETGLHELKTSVQEALASAIRAEARSKH